MTLKIGKEIVWREMAAPCIRAVPCMVYESVNLRTHHPPTCDAAKAEHLEEGKLFQDVKMDFENAKLELQKLSKARLGLSSEA